MSKLAIKSVGFTAYPVSDMERATAFYRDAVGLGDPIMLHDRWAEFYLNDTTFAVVTGGEEMGIAPGSAFAVAFEADDYGAAVEQLRAHGVEIDNEYDGPTCRAIFARDPDGNRFSVHKLKA